MSVLQARSERLNLSFPARFSADGEMTPGSCVNLSLSGVLARFARPLEIWIRGDIAIDTGRDIYTFRARVVRVVEHEAALAFVLATEVDRSRVRDLVAFAASHTQLITSRPPF